MPDEDIHVTIARLEERFKVVERLVYAQAGLMLLAVMGGLLRMAFPSAS